MSQYKYRDLIIYKHKKYTIKYNKSNKYNLLMKKTIESNFRRIEAKPAKTHSPDFRAGNSIKPTRSPQNIQYILKQNDRQKTPVKAWQFTKNQPHTQTTQSRYFQHNRNQYKSAVTPQSKTQPHSVQGYCHNCCSGNCHCVHAANNEEVVIQLKRIITMINGASVSPFDPSASSVKSQLQTLKLQNSRLTDLVSRLKSKSELKLEQNVYSFQTQIKILKQQLHQNAAQYEKQREQLYRANKTLSSQVKSLEDRNIKYSRQIQSLTKQLKQKQQPYQFGKKPGSQKLSLSIIKQQYNSSIQTLKSNLQYQVNNQLSDNQSQIRQYKYKLDVLEQRLKNCEKVNDINKILNQQNKRLKDHIQQSSTSLPMPLPLPSPTNQNKTQNQNNKVNQLQKQLANANASNKQKDNQLMQLNKQIEEIKIFYQNQIADLRQKNRNNQNTQAKVKKLMQNYQQQIKILKRQAKSNSCNHKDIQQQNQQLRQQNQQNWQQVIKLRNQLVKYTSQNSRLQHDNNQLHKQIGILKHQINNDHINLLARTALLQNQNERVKKQIEQNKKQHERIQAFLQDQNNKLRNQVLLKSSNAKNTHQLEKQLDQCRHKINGLTLENGQLLGQIDRMKIDFEQKQDQLKQNVKKQLEESRINYQDQIHKINQEIYAISHQYENLKIKYHQLQQKIQNLEQNQIKQRDHKIFQHQLTISNLGKIIQETQSKIGKLQDNLTQKYKQNEKIYAQMSALANNYEQKLRQNNDNWQNQINNQRVNLQNEINRLNKLLMQKQSQEQSTIMKLKSKINLFQSQSLKKQLEELKKLVDEGRFGRIQQQLAKVVQSYERQLIRSEQKTLQIDSITKDKIALQQKISDLQRLRLMLEQKVNILQGNIKIVQNQLKQRKSMCDNLLNQKIILEKQNLMLKKIKLDKESIQQTKNKARQISQKIDKLLAMEEQRQQTLMQASSIQSSQFMIQSRARKI